MNFVENLNILAEYVRSTAPLGLAERLAFIEEAHNALEHLDLPRSALPALALTRVYKETFAKVVADLADQSVENLTELWAGQLDADGIDTSWAAGRRADVLQAVLTERTGYDCLADDFLDSLPDDSGAAYMAHMIETWRTLDAAKRPY